MLEIGPTIYKLDYRLLVEPCYERVHNSLLIIMFVYYQLKVCWSVNMMRSVLQYSINAKCERELYRYHY